MATPCWNSHELLNRSTRKLKRGVTQEPGAAADNKANAGGLSVKKWKGILDRGVGRGVIQPPPRLSPCRLKLHLVGLDEPPAEAREKPHNACALWQNGFNK